MNFTFIRNKETVCQERASDVAGAKFDGLISECKAQGARRRSPENTSKYFKLLRQRSLFQRKAFEHYMDNYEVASDKYLHKEDADSSSLKGFTNYMIDELNRL